MEQQIAVAAGAALRAVSPGEFRLRAVSAAQLHLTLKFLGEQPAERLSVAQEALASALQGARSFIVRYESWGVFPLRGPARIVWCGIGAGAADLRQLAARVEERFAQFGFERDARPFTPHLTVARVTEDLSRGALRRAVGGLPALQLEQRIDGVTLFRSELRPAGAVYHPGCQVPLTNAG